MKNRKMMLLSIAVMALALLLSLAGIANRSMGGAEYAWDALKLLYVGLAAVAAAFVLAFIRFDLGSALALALTCLHDLLLTAALFSLVSIVLPMPALFPAALMLVVFMTHVQGVTVLTKIREDWRANKNKELSRDEAAFGATAKTRAKRLMVTIFALVPIVAGIVIASQAFVSLLFVIVLGLIVALYSACFILPALWADLKFGTKTRKVYR